MFLAIDAGNSNIVFALYQSTEQNPWSEIGRMDTASVSSEQDVARHMMSFLNARGVHYKKIERIGFSSVVPRINTAIIQACENLELGQRVRMLSPEMFKNLDLIVPRPDQIGSDLVADAYAAWNRNPNGYSLTVDFGTALTFTLINGKEKRIEGVNIMPGIRTALKSLFMNTAQLPEISLEYPESVIGKDTQHAIRAGILYGYNGAIKEMIRILAAEVGGNLKVFATGGMVKVLKDLHPFFDQVEPFLTVDGIRQLVQKA